MLADKTQKAAFTVFSIELLACLGTCVFCFISPESFNSLLVSPVHKPTSTFIWILLFSTGLVIVTIFVIFRIKSPIWSSYRPVLNGINYFVLLSTIWIFLESGVPEFIYPKYSTLWRLGSFFSFHLLLVPFLLFLSATYKTGKKLFRTIAWIMMSLFVFNFIWLYASGLKYPPTLVVIHLVIILSLIVVFITSLKELLSKGSKQSKPIFIGVTAIVLGAFLDLVTYYLFDPYFQSTSFFIGISLSIFLVTIVYINIKELSVKLTSAMGYQSLATNLPSGVFRANLDDKLTLTYANDAFYRLYGYENEKDARENGFIQGLSMSEGNVKHFVDDLREVMEKGRTTLVVEAAQKDRNQNDLWLQTHLQYLKSENQVLGSVVDLTGRKKAEDNLKSSEEELRISEEQYAIALSQASLFVYRYDIIKDMAYFSGAMISKYDLPKVVDKATSFFLTNGYIRESSREAFLDFFNRLNSGESKVICDFEVEMKNHKCIWLRQVATVFFDYGRPKYAIVSFSNVTEKRQQEMAFFDWQQKIKSMSKKDCVILKWNITSDVLETCEGDFMSLVCPVDNFEKKLGQSIFDRVCLEDRGYVSSALSIEKLLRNYNGQNYGFNLRFRVEHDGQIGYRYLDVKLISLGGNESILACLILRNLEASYMDDNRGLSDSLTSVLSRKAFEEKASKLSPKDYYIALMDIDGFQSINNNFGNDVGDQSLVNCARAIVSVVDTNGFVGRFGGDEFIVCAKSEKEEAKILAKRLCLRGKTTFSKGLGLTMTVGVGLDSNDYPSMVEKAKKSLQKAKTTNRGGFVLSDELKK